MWAVGAGRWRAPRGRKSGGGGAGSGLVTSGGDVRPTAAQSQQTRSLCRRRWQERRSEGLTGGGQMSLNRLQNSNDSIQFKIFPNFD
jgi:hypothetical protein